MKPLSTCLCLALLVIGSLSVPACGAAPSGPTPGQHTSRYCDTCPRDSRGRIERSDQATREFMKQNPLPEKCPTRADCIIDHKTPLGSGGADDPGNMQWQTRKEAKEKDKCERQGCR